MVNLPGGASAATHDLVNLPTRVVKALTRPVPDACLRPIRPMLASAEDRAPKTGSSAISPRPERP